MIETTQQTRQCPSCRAAVAEDQSYCLSCGARQARARARVEPAAAGPVAAPSELVPSGLAPERDWTPVVALGGLAVLALVLVIGVLIGRSGQGTTKAAAAPQVIQLQGSGAGAATPTGTGAAGGSTAAAVGKISDEWPSGKSGWTVALQSLAKSGATPGSVNAAKSAASRKGANKVGVLDASNYTALGSGYVIYSGLYSSRAQATAALAKLKKSFPSANVVHVVQPGGGGGGGGAGASSGPPPSAAQQQAGAAAIQSLTNCSGSACSKAARKITQPIATPGAAPPKDKKAAGGGSGGGQSFQ
jgi:hypothetical protein